MLQKSCWLFQRSALKCTVLSCAVETWVLTTHPSASEKLHPQQGRRASWWWQGEWLLPFGRWPTLMGQPWQLDFDKAFLESCLLPSPSPWREEVGLVFLPQLTLFLPVATYLGAPSVGACRGWSIGFVLVQTRVLQSWHSATQGGYKNVSKLWSHNWRKLEVQLFSSTGL